MNPILQIENLNKSFGGVVATDGCSLEVFPGQIHAIIGPNGAGKTTLLAQLSGELFSDSGRILLRGVDISHAPIHQRVAAGMMRSYQITNLFKSLSVLQNLALAVQSRTGHSFSMFRSVASEHQLESESVAIAQRIGLDDELHSLVGTLSHGKQRVLELGLLLACGANILLCDEPTAGTDPEESQRMGDLIQSLRGDHTIILVEHDMDAVFRLADRISVLVSGKVIFTGTPDAVRKHPDVIQAYLGQDPEGVSHHE